jgi:hypothetical protein
MGNDEPTIEQARVQLRSGNYAEAESIYRRFMAKHAPTPGKFKGVGSL